MAQTGQNSVKKYHPHLQTQMGMHSTFPFVFADESDTRELK
jgi:hypothetical protein